MEDIEAIIQFQKNQIRNEKSKLEELELLEELIEGDTDSLEVSISNVADGYYEFRMEVDELTGEVSDTLDFSIIKDMSVESNNGGVVITGHLTYTPMKVSSSLMKDYE